MERLVCEKETCSIGEKMKRREKIDANCLTLQVYVYFETENGNATDDNRIG